MYLDDGVELGRIMDLTEKLLKCYGSSLSITKQILYYDMTNLI